jgi:hypothetical protein
MRKLDNLISAINIRDEVYASKAMDVWKMFQNGRSSYLIFLDNSKIVRSSIKKLNSIAFRGLNNDGRWRLQRAVVKDLHNAVSSGQNFLDHLHYTHGFSEKVHDKEYSVFFRELRNYLVHNNSFDLVSRSEYRQDTEAKFYQAMDKQAFYKFVNDKRLKICNKLQSDPATVLTRENELLRDLSVLLNFLDNKEDPFDFAPILNQYIVSLNEYYSKWVLLLLKKQVTMSSLKLFLDSMQIVHSHFPFNYSESRLRYLKIAYYKKSKRSGPGA